MEHNHILNTIKFTQTAIQTQLICIQIISGGWNLAADNIAITIVSQLCWNWTHDSYRYNAVQNIMTMHAALQQEGDNINQTFNSQIYPYIALAGDLHVYVEYGWNFGEI